MPRPQPQRFEPTSPPPDRPRKRRWLRSLLVTCGVLIVLAGVALVGRWWVLNQYYIGANSADEVVIFQGVQGSVLGVSLNWQVETSCPMDSATDCTPIKLSDLQEAQRPDVRNGITRSMGCRMPAMRCGGSG